MRPPTAPQAGAVGATRRSARMPSSVIRRFSYDEPRRCLRVTFVSGEVYEYDGVPPEVNAAFREAFSKGQFFGPNIRDRYPFRRIERDWRCG
ncbi:MAG: KTSC domain-containing protein [Brevundimonas sp.]|uniref:KTSC domain-containing protein n=1 Tax=Brevundimonas sp. TaxID=1871086 RepID=UPI00391D345B